MGRYWMAELAQVNGDRQDLESELPPFRGFPWEGEFINCPSPL